MSTLTALFDSCLAVASSATNPNHAILLPREVYELPLDLRYEFSTSVLFPTQLSSRLQGAEKLLVKFINENPDELQTYLDESLCRGREMVAALDNLVADYVGESQRIQEVTARIHLLTGLHMSTRQQREDIRAALDELITLLHTALRSRLDARGGPPPVTETEAAPAAE
jgi:hypothetical protein